MGWTIKLEHTFYYLQLLDKFDSDLKGHNNFQI